MGKAHPDAAKSFNRRGISLLDCIERREKFPVGTPWEFRPDRHATKTIANPVGRIVVEHANQFTGEKFDLCISLAKGVGVLTSGCASEFRSLVRAVSACAPFSGRVSEEFIRKTLLDWIAESLDGIATLQLADYIEERFNSVVRKCEVWIPIANLHLESTLELGGVNFQTITSEFMDARAAGRISKVDPADAAEFRRLLEYDRQRLQGLAAGVVKLEAETGFAAERGLDIVEENLALLRVCHPANASWRTSSYCLPFGSEGAGTTWMFVLGDRGILLEQERYRRTAPEPWVLSDKEIEELRRFLHPLRRLLAIDKPTSFQSRIKNSLVLYSRNNLATDIANKLTFVFAALDSMLLKDSGESIQQNVAERFAFLMGREVSQRAELAKLFKNVYGLRSRYLHHGDLPQEGRELDAFLLEAWLFFMQLPALAAHFRTREELFAHLDRLKFA